MNKESYMLGYPSFNTSLPCSYMRDDMLRGVKIGYAYVPYQYSEKMYCEEEALKYGTAFPELNKPLGVYGYEFCQCSK